MKTNLLFLILLLAAFNVNTIAQNFAWAKKMGGGGYDYGNSIAVDDSGNVYITGTFYGTVDFDPGAGIVNLTSAGSADIFVSKLDASGSLVWAKKLGGVSDDEGFGIAVDGFGNVYTTGYFRGTADFDPGVGTFNITTTGGGGSDIFVSKLDASGNFVWAKKMGGISWDNGSSIAVDDFGNVYTTGDYAGTADFDPGVGTANLTSAGGSDIFISKLDASGNFVWAKKMGGANFDEGYSIAVDVSGNVYITGTFYGTVDFDPGAGIVNLTSAGSSDIFVSKLDALGNFVWAKRMGGTDMDTGDCIAVDAFENVYTTGYFRGTVDFDPGIGIVNLSSAGSDDIFVSKLDALGNFVWAKRMGGTSMDIGDGIVVDTSGNVYTSGFFIGTVDFDPGTGTVNLTSAGGSRDVFVSKLDALGNFVWAKKMGGTSDDESNSLAVDASENVYTTGYFTGTADFDPGVSIFNLSSSGIWDIFVSKLSCPIITTDVQTACDSLTWIDGITYNSSTSTPTFNIVGGAANGCDSIVILNLTINSNTATDVVNTCDSITWIDGNTYFTNTSTPIFTLTNAVGCDSVVNLNLTINNTSSSTNVVTACDFITWIDGITYTSSTNTPTFTLINAVGCDSVVTLNLTINNTSSSIDVVTACDSIIWIDGNTYSASTNTPTFNIVGGAVNGCDSIVTLNLTIYNATTGPYLDWAYTVPANLPEGQLIAKDLLGNMYVGGVFSGTIDFDPGVGIVNLTSNGGIDFYIQKIDPLGNLIWATSFGGIGTDKIAAITCDFNGDLLVTGAFQGIVDFDPGASTTNLSSAGNNDAFIQKLSSTGNLIWAKAMGGLASDEGRGIAVDASGSVYSIGIYSGLGDFDPGAGYHPLTPVGGNYTYIHKLDINGNFIWAETIGGSSYDTGVDIAVDANGNAYILGIFAGTSDLRPGAAVYNRTSNGFGDIFVLKVDSNCSYKWVKTFGGGLLDQAHSLELDNSGNIYATGSFQLTTNFNQGYAGVMNRTSNGQFDIFTVKIDPVLGATLWVRTSGSTGDDEGQSISLDNLGNIYLTGYYNGTVDFTIGLGNSILTSNGGDDVFIVKMPEVFGAVDAISIGGTSNDNGSSLISDNNGNVHVAGIFTGTVDFDPGANTTNLTSSGSNKLFVLKLTDINPAIFGTDIISSCAPYTWTDGNIYLTNNNTALDTLTNMLGCDSVVTLNLTILNSMAIDTQIVCDSLIWIDNVTYTLSTNTPTFTLTNAAGCDSVVTLNLTILNTTTSIDTQVACDSLTWIDGLTYTSSTNAPTFNIVGGATNGCDSVVTLNLTINSLNASYTSIDNGGGNYTFTNTSTGSFTQTHWAFGDGTTSTLANPTHTFSANGTFVVVLTTNDSTTNNICMDYYLDTLVVIGVVNPVLCAAGFVMYPDGNNNVTVVNSSTGNNLTYFWDFGDGDTSTMQFPSHTYATAGPFYLCLTVNDGASCVDTYCDSIGINGVVFNKQTGFTINVIAPPVVVGVNEQEVLATEVTIYPNPTTNEFVVELTNFSPSTQINIISVEGKMVYTNSSINTRKIIVDAADWSKGIYVVKITDKQSSKVVKLIKQ